MENTKLYHLYFQVLTLLLFPFFQIYLQCQNPYKILLFHEYNGKLLYIYDKLNTSFLIFTLQI